MGDTAAETLSEIDASRQRLESDLAALEARLPDKDELATQAKVYGGAAVGVFLGLIGLILSLKRRSERRDRERHARETARALAEIMDVIPVEATARVDHASSRTGPIALVAAIAGLVIAIANGLRSRR